MSNYVQKSFFTLGLCKMELSHQWSVGRLVTPKCSTILNMEKRESALYENDTNNQMHLYGYHFVFIHFDNTGVPGRITNLMCNSSSY